ncbi:MAG: HNH endonuclease, partial [Actinomycetia bacterium]|nr:HNH endonuclease [Actinomycetes bacterium]
MSGSSLRPVGVEELRRLVARLSVPSPVGSDAERIDRIRALEELKNAAAAAQARESVAFDASQREGQRLAGVPEGRVGRGVADQVALARRVSPHQGSRLLGLAKSLVHDLP